LQKTKKYTDTINTRFVYNSQWGFTVFSQVFRVTGKSLFQTGKAALLNYFSTITLKWKYHDETRNVAYTTIGSNMSRVPYKTLDVCDSCYKERIDAQINVEKKKFKATSKTYGETPRI